MNENLRTINEAFKKSGIEVNHAEYSITEYSLNTDLSFKFTNVAEFLAFLEIDAVNDVAGAEQVTAKLIEAGINPEAFFYVNFYKPKVAEL